MKLGVKTLILLVMMMAALVLALYIASTQVVGKGFSELEERYARRNVDRVLRAIESRGRDLDTATADWATWDDTYQFASDGNKEYIEANLMPETFEGLKIHVLLIADGAGKVVWGKVRDQESARPRPAPDELVRLVKPGALLTQFSPQHDRIQGVVLLEEGPMLVAARPILTSEKEGPARGALLMGRYLDEGQIRSLSDSLQFQITAFRADALPRHPWLRQALAALSHGKPSVIRTRNATTIAGYGLVRDPRGKPVVLVEVAMPREIFAQGRRTTAIFAGLLVLVGICFSVGIVVMLRRQVIARLEYLSRAIRRITRTEDFTQRVSLSGSDELAGVADDVNQMLSAVVESRQALESSEEQFRRLFDNALNAVALHEIVLDEQGRPVDYIFLQANAAFETHTGMRVADVLGRRVTEIHPGIIDTPLIETYGKVALTGEPVSFELFFEPAQRDYHVTAYRVGDGRFAAIFADITERKRAEEQARASQMETERLLGVAQQSSRALLSIMEDQQRAEAQRAALEEQIRQQQRLETVGQLAAGVAHDFNNVLTGITGFTRFALDAAPEGSTARDDLTQVLALTRRASELTHQLLAFSRRQTLQPVVLNINQVIGDLVNMLRRLLGEHIDLLFDPAADLGNVKADPGQIEQVLMNLAVNARDAMPDGGKLTIETANVELDDEYARAHDGTQPGPYVMLAVTDNGCGMEASIRERIFEPFFTTKEVGKGTGLGMATAYGIVKQHGGNIWVYSEPGNGTTIKVYLPRVGETTAKHATDAPENAPDGEGTILIVEDEPAVLNIATRTLEMHGYRVLTATKPSEADAVLATRGHEIALLLTDLMMPERNGRQLYETARANFPTLRILFMSGYTDDAIAHQSVLDHGTPFIQKPFTADALARKVREAMGGGRE